ncbi:MAG: cell wall hydrolase [Thermaerobacter sp.]|nr:cell wall hydrolase [Thermaerobacter sp.]
MSKDRRRARADQSRRARAVRVISLGAVVWTASMVAGVMGLGVVDAASPPSAPAVPGAPTAALGTWVAQATHVRLTWGDTLWQLANTYGVSVAALQAANHLGSSTTIYAGSMLVIPGRFLVTEATTLPALATALGVPAAALEALNVNRPVTVGATVWVPPVGAATAAAATVVSNQSLTDLAHLVQAEAGNQPFLGMVAVAAVVLNRVASPGFPKSIAAVIFASGQFESVQNGTYWQAPSAQAYQAAEAALGGEDPTHGALYFFNPALTQNSWIEGLPVVARIGQQVFSR